jgi:hypothetical protein
MKTLAITVVLLLFPLAAHGAGIDLTWSACPGGGSYSEIEFPCGCPGLAVPLFGTFTSFVDVQDFVAVDFWLDLQNDAATLQDFWTFNTPNTPSACNVGIDLRDDRPSGECGGYATPWGPFGNQAGVALSFIPNFGGVQNRGRIVGSVYRTDGGSTTVTAGVPTFAFRLDIYPDFATESGGPCAGCSTPTQILFLQANLVSETQPPVALASGGTVGQIVTSGYPGGHEFTCLPTPTRRQTWGLLKSLYR